MFKSHCCTNNMFDMIASFLSPIRISLRSKETEGSLPNILVCEEDRAPYPERPQREENYHEWILIAENIKVTNIHWENSLVKFSLVIYFPCNIVLIYQECGDSACRSHNEITRQRGQINTLGVGLLRTRNSGKFYTVCVIILHGVFCV